MYFFRKDAKKKNCQKSIKFGDCKVNKIQIEKAWYVAVRHIGIVLGVSSDTLKGTVRNHLPQQNTFSRKEIGTDISCDGSKLFTTILDPVE